jgi:diphosphate-dependent phosphofructokinase
LEKGPHLEIENHEALGAVADHEDIKKCFPHTYGRARISLKECAVKKTHAALRVGVVLSGGQAPGGHNVIAGIYDYIKK